MRLCHIALFCLTLLLSACEKKTAPGGLPPVDVTTIIVERKTVPAKYEYVGVAVSSHPVEIRARVEGYLDTLAYIEGSVVQEGQLLFQIDPRPFEAALDNAKAELERAKAVLWNADQSVKRLKPLYEKNAASLRDLDNALASQMSAQADVDAAQAKVVTAELNLNYTTITSPITGLSGASNFREGALISPGRNDLLTNVSVIDPIWVNFNVSEGDELKARQEIKKGQLEYPKDMNFTVEVILSDGTVFPDKGVIDFANPTYQQTTGTMLIRAVLPNPDGLLKPGQFVRANAMGAKHPNAIVVPQQAVQQGKSGMYVFVLSKDKKAEVRGVTVGDWYENSWIITSGLKPGEEVIVTGVNKVRPGSTVNVKKVEK